MIHVGKLSSLPKKISQKLEPTLIDQLTTGKPITKLLLKHDIGTKCRKEIERYSSATDLINSLLLQSLGHNFLLIN